MCFLFVYVLTIENINPQLSATSISPPIAVASTNINNNDKNVNKAPDRAVTVSRPAPRTKRLQNKAVVNTDDTLSTIQPPKYNYNALMLVPKKQPDRMECEKNSVAEPEDEEPHIEYDDTPPSIENPREFLIEDFSIDGGSQICQTQSNQPRTVASILNTGNSVFLSSQLLIDGNQTASSQQFFTAPDTVETQCDNLPEHELIKASEEMIPPRIDIVGTPPPEKRRRIDPEAITGFIPADVVAETTHRDNIPQDEIMVDDEVLSALKIRSSSELVTGVADVAFTTDGVQAIVVDASETPTDTVQIETCATVVSMPSSSSFMTQESAIVVAQPTPPPRPTGFEWIPQIPSSMNYTYLHYIDIENVSYRYEVERLPSDIAYNICKQQEGLRTTINFKCDGLHRIEIRGECVKKLLKLKYKEWRAVQAVLELIKKFTYNSRAKEPKSSSLLERTLHYLFASTSKFSNVHIQRILYDEEQNRDVCRVLETTYKLKPKSKRLHSTIDPYVLDEIHHEMKRLKSN